MTSWAGLLLAAVSLWAMLALVFGRPLPGDGRGRLAFMLAWALGVLGTLWSIHRRHHIR